MRSYCQKLIFGSDLGKVIIYGSYARGDYTNNSDVDVMILVKISDEEIKQYSNQVSDSAFDYFMKYGIARR